MHKIDISDNLGYIFSKNAYQPVLSTYLLVWEIEFHFIGLGMYGWNY